MLSARPSETARRVAARRLRFARVPAAYGDPAADEALAADVAAGFELAPSRMGDYLAARTSFFDRVVVRAIEAGVPQVVIGAAGYDGRALRYARPGVRWFEVDHPATQRDKRERLARLGILAPHVRFVAADFRTDPVADLLRAAGLDPGAGALFLLEGVAVYLEPAVLEALLRQLREVAAVGSRLAVSVSLSHRQAARAAFQASVAAMGEPTMSSLEAGEAEALLASTGWQARGAQAPGDQSPGDQAARLRSAGFLVATAAVPPPEGS
jgi:methyltransferase (TIGR00027 family)